MFEHYKDLPSFKGCTTLLPEEIGNSYPINRLENAAHGQNVTYQCKPNEATSKGLRKYVIHCSYGEWQMPPSDFLCKPGKLTMFETGGRRITSQLSAYSLPRTAARALCKFNLQLHWRFHRGSKCVLRVPS